MLFNSFEFMAFFIVFLFLFFSLPFKFQPITILIASYIFYAGWRPSFTLLLLFTTILDYTSALVMANASSQRIRRAAMIVALTINLGILGTVKYLDFIISSVVGTSGYFGFEIPDYALNLILPVGISFYTFQSVGYTLDVYFRGIEAERSFLTYAQYVAFFPQLVAGPIERAGHMLPQYRKKHFLRLENIPSGLWLIGYGLFKKMCIADSVSPFVHGVYSSPDDFSGAYHIIASIFFAIQIYCDFSGYSDIARGVARIMDFELMVNFRQPYFSTSLKEFWTRWHISLSTWFRDYLYFPLGGNRVSELKWARNILVVFAVSGVWHGAAWTFVIWGLLHGVGQLLERAVGKITPPRIKDSRTISAALPIVGWLWTMTIVLIGWVFFRSSSLMGAAHNFESLGNIGRLSYGTFKELGLPSFEIGILGVSLIILLVTDWLIAFRPGVLHRLQNVRFLPSFVGVILAYYIIMFGVFGRTDFIYFQF